MRELHETVDRGGVAVCAGRVAVTHRRTRRRTRWTYAAVHLGGLEVFGAVRPAAGSAPDPRYFYQPPAGGQPIGGVEPLRTYPPKKSARPFRFVAWGDSGTGSGTQLQLASTLSSLAPAPKA